MDSKAVIASAFERAHAGDLQGAAQILQQALKQSPQDTALLVAFGQVRWHGKDYLGAINTLRQATMVDPSAPGPKQELARALWSTQRLGEAMAEYEQLVRLRPGEIGGWEELAQVFLSAGQFEEGWNIFRRATAAMPGNPTPYLRWVQTAVRIGEVEAGLRVARAAAAEFPQAPEVLENLCLALAFADSATPEEIFERHKELGTLATTGVRRAETPFANTRLIDRRLKVAFLSTDFRFHACAFFLASLLTKLDRGSVEVFCYALNAPDQVSQAFAGLGTYRDLRSLTDDGIAQTARQDGIDILIDCSGWSRGHRMDALVPRIAPVQINYLGYSNTTGLPTMDYRIVDQYTDPAGAERFATEKLIRMSRSFVCFTVPEHTPHVGETPAMRAAAARTAAGPITFGCFNRLEKVQGRTLACWARILQQAPESTILLKAERLTPGRISLERRFAAAGGDVSRVRWVGWEDDPAAHLRAHHQVDIALDPFPYNGTTTTCEALLMGVPVVTLEGSQHRSRVGSSLLRNAGLSELVARDEAGYVSVAAGLAKDPARLLAMRQGLRERFMRSPVCHALPYAQEFERALRTAWETWCRGQA